MPGRSLLTVPEFAAAESVSPWPVADLLPRSFIVMAEEADDAEEEEEYDNEEDDEAFLSRMAGEAPGWSIGF